MVAFASREGDGDAGWGGTFLYNLLQCSVETAFQHVHTPLCQ